MSYLQIPLHRILVAALALVLGVTLSGTSWAQMSMPEIDDFQDIKPMRAALVITEDPDAVRDSLARGDDKIQIIPVKESKKGTRVAAVVVFGDCPTDERYHCMLRADFEVISPDGKTHGKMAGQDIWYDLPTPPEGALQVGRGGVQLKLDDGDSLGVYIVRANVRDEITGEVVTLQAKVEFVEELTREEPKDE